MEAALSQRRFTVEEFHRMGEAGILHEDDRIELLDGQIIEMAPIGSRHAGCVNRLNRLFTDRLGAAVVVAVQNPLPVSRYTELVPDLMLLRPRDDFYAEAHPGPEDILLVVEVADTTLDYDRRMKIPLYGEAGIQETWLVSLPDRWVEVFRNPSGETGYRESFSVPEGQAVESAGIPGLAVKVDELLP